MMVAPLERSGWVHRAACRGRMEVNFFPDNNQLDDRRIALEVCSTCPVRTPCFLEVMSESYYDNGIRGGYTERQRKIMRSIMRRHDVNALTARMMYDNGFR